MFNSEILEVGIGLVFVYLLLCLLCAGIKEAVARVLAWRSKTLEEALKKLLNNPELLKEIYQNSLLSELHLGRWYHKILGFLPVFKQRGKKKKGTDWKKMLQPQLQAQAKRFFSWGLRLAA